ncbi:MAG: FUSC family protein [Acidobacteriota bacterium]
MANEGGVNKLIGWVRTEWRHLTTINASDRRWPMPFAAALASALPLLVGAYFHRMDYGLTASLGGLSFLYLASTPLWHRMVVLMACAFGMTACYALGVMSHQVPALMMPVLVFTAILVTMVCRFYNLGPPGSLFFIMAASIGAYTPGEIEHIPLKVGLLTMGALLACLIAFFYSVFTLPRQPARPPQAVPVATFDFVVFDSVVIGVFVGISLALAQALQLQKAYWVPVSCLAVIQGMSLRAVWNRQLQRIIGTGLGLLVAWALLLLPLDAWRMCGVIFVLTFIVETVVVRHYGLATIFITPLTILLAEAATLGRGSVGELMQARFMDTVLGCLVGLIGGVCLHSPAFRRTVGRPLRYLIPERVLP